MLRPDSNIITYLLLLFIFIQASLFGTSPLLNHLSEKSAYRYKYNFIVPVYDVTLSLPEGANPEQLLSGSYPFSLNFHYLRHIQKDIIIQSAEFALQKNLSAEEFAEIKIFMDALHASYSSVKKGDRSTFIYCPEQGLQFSFNNSDGLTIADLNFASQYFKIWFGDFPLSLALKKNLLKL